MESKRVLVVCRSHWVRALLRSQLRMGGFTALGAATPKTALSYAVETSGAPFCLLVFDCSSLPGGRFPIDGARELTERIKALHPGAKTLVICEKGERVPPGTWDAVFPRPAALEEVVARAAELISDGACDDAALGT